MFVAVLWQMYAILVLLQWLVPQWVVDVTNDCIQVPRMSLWLLLRGLDVVLKL